MKIISVLLIVCMVWICNIMRPQDSYKVYISEDEYETYRKENPQDTDEQLRERICNSIEQFNFPKPPTGLRFLR
jgi:hypothetical protein